MTDPLTQAREEWLKNRLNETLPSLRTSAVKVIALDAFDAGAAAQRKISQDHATVARLLTSGKMRWDQWIAGDSRRGELTFDGIRHVTQLDEFGVPMLTYHLRSVIARAEAQS